MTDTTRWAEGFKNRWERISVKGTVVVIASMSAVIVFVYFQGRNDGKERFKEMTDSRNYERSQKEYYQRLYNTQLLSDLKKEIERDHEKDSRLLAQDSAQNILKIKK